MMQTIQAAGNSANAFLGSAGAVMVDEVHHSPSITWLDVLNKCPARNRWGVTATPERTDGLGDVIRLAVGDCLFEIKAAELIKHGFLSQPVIQPIETGVEINLDLCLKWDGRIDYTKAVTRLMENTERQRQIMMLAKAAYNNGRSVLILFPRKVFAVDMAKMLKARGFSAEAVTSSSNKKKRASIIKDVRDGKVMILCATQLADEGLDLPALDTLINAAAGKAKGRAIQRVGRIMRVTDSKKIPIVFDLVDGPPFLYQWPNRMAAYHANIGVMPRDLMTAEEAKDSLKDQK